MKFYIYKRVKQGRYSVNGRRSKIIRQPILEVLRDDRIVGLGDCGFFDVGTRDSEVVPHYPRELSETDVGVFLHD